jgi:hypothetical protein
MSSPWGEAVSLAVSRHGKALWPGDGGKNAGRSGLHGIFEAVGVGCIVGFKG